jgi:UDP:flavonoid glycosyltransferase YjiC (YdhE family)
MIVLPLFWDQYDNAQRVAECGFGARLPTYELDDGQLRDAIERLLAANYERLGAVSARLQASPGTVKAADLILELARRS